MCIAAQTNRTNGQQINRQVRCICRVADTIVCAATTVERICGCASDEGVITQATCQVLDIGIGIALCIAAQTNRTNGQQINRQVRCICRVADTIVCAATTVERICGCASDEGVITQATCQVLDIGIGIALCIAAQTNRTNGQQIYRQVRCICRVANTVVCTATAVESIRCSIRDKQIIAGTADHVLNRNVLIALCIPTSTCSSQQINRHSASGSSVANGIGT